MAEKHVHKPLTESKPIKKSKFEKALGLFLAEDVNMVSDSILEDFIKPRMSQFGTDATLKLKEFIAESLIGCIQILIFGKKTKKSNGGGVSYYSSNYTSSGSKVNYVSYYDGEPVITTSYGQNLPDTNSYGIELRGIATYGDAARVRDELRAISSRYSRGASVADYYELVGKTPVKTDYQHGWVKLGEVDILPYKGQYIIDLPKPRPLDN